MTYMAKPQYILGSKLQKSFSLKEEKTFFLLPALFHKSQKEREEIEKSLLAEVLLLTTFVLE